MRRLTGALKPDIIHAHTARALLMLYPKSGGARVILTHHNSHLSFSPRMFKLFDRIVEAYVAISKETEAILHSHVRRAVAYIPNAASKSFAAKAPRASPGPKRQILSVGTISAQKNYDLLIDTAVVLKSRLSPTEMPEILIAGNGVDLETMRTRTLKEGVAGHVTFLGERSDVAELMAGSDLYLNTSRYEGMPVSLLEAMASGLPIIATRVAGNTELVGHQENGLLCPLDEPSALADSILRIFSDTELYSACSRGAIEKAGLFSIETTARNHIALFERPAA